MTVNTVNYTNRNISKVTIQKVVKVPLENNETTISTEVANDEKPVVEMVPYTLPKDPRFTIKVIPDTFVKAGKIDMVGEEDKTYLSLTDVKDAIRSIVSCNVVDVKANKGILLSSKNCRIKDFVILVDGKPSPIKVWFSFKHENNEKEYNLIKNKLCADNYHIHYPVNIYVPNLVPKE